LFKNTIKLEKCLVQVEYKCGPERTIVGSKFRNIASMLYRYIMLGRGICEKYQSRDEQFPEPNGEGNLVSRLVFFTNTPAKHDISV
jgi:hypothetical protein